ncbi:MAG: hypothetical protein QOF51_2428 [Chloroflexota bacterium]|nr:hypothetical protein [Chloroflexota bacterium]
MRNGRYSEEAYDWRNEEQGDVRARIAGALGRLSLAQQFLLASFVILFANMVMLCWWVGKQIELGVVHNTACATALYVDSFLEPLLQPLAQANELSPAQMDSLSALLAQSALKDQIVAFKLWAPTGRILYSTDPDTIGQTFPPSEGLRGALRGAVTSDISDLEAEENVTERGRFSRLMEIYSPVRETGTAQIIAVAEYYRPLDELEGEIAAARTGSWLVVGLGTLLTYLLLAGLVQGGSNTIRRQQTELRDHVTQLTALLAQNAELHDRVQRAARRTTELNEQFLRRISAELHDGPAQDLALALLRLDSLAVPPEGPGAGAAAGPNAAAERERIQSSLDRALQEIRAISSGLRLPELAELTLEETLARVARMHERRTDSTVQLDLRDLPDSVPLPVKITAYRLVQEALSNAYRHGGGRGQRVCATAHDGLLHIEIADTGSGFDASQPVHANGHLGLAGMRERVESQGGRFGVESMPGSGTRVWALLALRTEEGVDA